MLEEIQSEVQKLKEKVEDTEGLLHSQPTESNYQRKRQMLKRQASSFIKSHRLKRRKLSNQGPKPKLDEEDEDFIAKAMRINHPIMVDGMIRSFIPARG